MTVLTRRRFISIAAATLACGLSSGARAAAAPLYRWRGVALGAEASITLAHPDPEAAARLMEAVEGEIDRLEALFSLYRADSALSRLNARGVLENPPPDFLSLLSLSGRVHAATAGRFDPSVQPLWRLHADHFAAPGASPRGPSDAAIAAARAATGWRHVRFDTLAVRLARPGMALTFNGIAQGYASDRVAQLLRAAGMTHVLVSLGEIRALGPRPDGRPWRVGLADRGDARPDATLLLADAALATTAPLGTRFAPGLAVGHIIDPASGRAGAGLWRRVSVLAPSAAVADGLSTGFALMTADEIRRALAAFPDTRAIALAADSEQCRSDFLGDMGVASCA